MATLQEISKQLGTQTNILVSTQKDMSKVADALQDQVKIFNAQDRKAREAAREQRGSSHLLASSRATRSGGGRGRGRGGDGVFDFLKALSPAAVGTSLGLLGTRIFTGATGLLKGAGLIAFYPILKPLANQLGESLSNGLVNLFTGDDSGLDLFSKMTDDQKAIVRDSVKSGISTGLLAALFFRKGRIIKALIVGGLSAAIEASTKVFPETSEEVAENVESIFPGLAKAVEGNEDLVKDAGLIGATLLVPRAIRLAVGGVRAAFGTIFGVKATATAATAASRTAVMASPFGIALLAGIASAGIYTLFKDEIDTLAKDVSTRIKDALGGTFEKVREALRDTPLEGVFGFSDSDYTTKELSGRDANLDDAKMAKNRAMALTSRLGIFSDELIEARKAIRKMQDLNDVADTAQALNNITLPASASPREKSLFDEFKNIIFQQKASLLQAGEINEEMRARNAENNKGFFQSFGKPMIDATIGEGTYFNKFLNDPILYPLSVIGSSINTLNNQLQEQSRLVKEQQRNAAASNVVIGDASNTTVNNPAVISLGGEVQVLDANPLQVPTY